MPGLQVHMAATRQSRICLRGPALAASSTALALRVAMLSRLSCLAVRRPGDTGRPGRAVKPAREPTATTRERVRRSISSECEAAG